jgi:hypothetical protein
VTTLRDIASVVRSKNAGPFWMTIDVFFDDAEHFGRGIATDLSDPTAVAEIYGVEPECIRVFVLRELLAVKISMPRPRTQGSFGDTDMHAGQQFVPLLAIDVD